MSAGRVEIRQLARDELAASIAEFVGIAADVAGEYWAAQHFLSDRPRKWELSSAAWQGGTPVGYAIVSERGPGHAHLHHFMLAPAARGCGLGSRLAQFMIELAKGQGYRQLTLKVAADDQRALRFYRRLGFADGRHDGRLLWLSRDLAA
jgi:ribosomal protein S18 acetylase RimI-like enzyme